MARSGFASTVRLELAEQPVLDYPFTVSIHFNAVSFGGFPYLWALTNTGVTTDYLGMLLDTSGHVMAAVATVASTPPGVASTTAASLNTDNVATAVFASATDRRVFLNGGGKATDATSAGWPAGLNLNQVGLLRRTTVSDTFNGRVSHLAIWNEALSDAEIAQLGARVDPRKVRLDRLIRYHPLNGTQGPSPEPDVLGRGKSFLPVLSPTVFPQSPVIMSPAMGVRRRLAATSPSVPQLPVTLELCLECWGDSSTPGVGSANPGAFFAVL